MLLFDRLARRLGYVPVRQLRLAIEEMRIAKAEARLYKALFEEAEWDKLPKPKESDDE